MTTPLRIFLPLTKVDEEKRLVYGRVAVEELDQANEIFDYASSKPNFQAWSEKMAKSSGGKNLGNVRVMHTAKAAGMMVGMDYDDTGKAIEGCAKVVDDDEWKKVLAGVYTGFSMGGSYAKRWKDESGAQRYTAMPVEVSLVDAPCIKSATFEVIKGAGVSNELRKFHPWEPSSADIAVEAEVLCKAASGPSWAMFIEKARDSLIAKRRGDDAPVDAELAKAFEAKVTVTHDGKDGKEEAGVDGEKVAEGDAKAGEDDKKPAGDKDAKGTEGKEEGKVEGMAGEDDKPADDGDDAKAKAQALADKKEQAAKAARDEISQVWQAKDGKTFLTKADCVAHQVAVVLGENPLTAALAGLKKDISGEQPKPADPMKVELEKHAVGLRDLATFGKLLPLVKAEFDKTDGAVLRKSVYDIGSFAMAINTLASIQSCLAMEADYEKDDSKVPLELRNKIADLVGIFLRTAAEEMGEMVAGMPGGVIQVTNPAADPEIGVLMSETAKALPIAELSKRTPDQERLNAMLAALVAKGIAPKVDAEAAETLAKVTLERDGLSKLVADAVPAIEALRKDVALLKAQPNPSAPRLNVLEKGGTEAQPAALPTDPQELLAVMAKNFTGDQISAMLIKAAQARPMSLTGR